MTWVRGITFAAPSLAVLALAAGVVAIAHDAPAAVTAWFAGTVIMGLPSMSVGLLIARRQPDNGIAALLAVAGLGVLVAGASDVYLAAAEQAPGVLPVSGLWVSAVQGIWILLYLPWALILLVFPRGRPASGFARVTALVLIGVAVSFALLSGFVPGPYASAFQEEHRLFPRWDGSDLVAVAMLPLFLAALVASVLVVAREYRRAEPSLRNQYRGLALAGTALPGSLLLCWAGYFFTGDSSVVVLGLGIMYLLIPPLVATAILRHEVLDAGAVLVEVVSTGLLVLLVGALAAAAGWLARGRAELMLPVVLGVALGAVLLALQRPRAQRLVGRVLYPERERVLTALVDFQGRIFSDAARPEELGEVLRTAMDDPQLLIGYRLAGSPEPVDAAGGALGHRDGYPVYLGGREIGLLAPGPGNRMPPPAEVLAALTLPLELGRQRLELATALREVEASRTRILESAQRERTRLERDLHDGAQQRLVALGMTLRLAQRRLGTGREETGLLLEEAVAELGTAVAELRAIAHGMRPSSLDNGLRAALTELQGRTAIPLDMDITGELHPLPELVGTTAYFVASEAIANAVKYSAAGRIGLTVHRSADGLRVRVLDDGCGGADITAGGGLAGLADRIGALGGSIRVRSPLGGGTVVEAVLPCG